MKRTAPTGAGRACLLLALAWLGACGVQAQKLLGGDISMLPSYEQAGATYRDFDGRPVEALPFLKQMGWNAMRVRLFVEPQHAPQKYKDEGVCQDFDYVLKLGRRIQQAGFQLMLDFHYSDYWADPGKQYMPHLWKDTRREDLPDSLFQYTRRTLLALKRQGVVPQLIQVGNETTNGMLWPLGKIAWGGKAASQGDGQAKAAEAASWDYLCQLYQAGSRACREVCPQAKVIIHTEKTGNWEVTSNYYLQLRSRGVDYDVIGLSYYPMWQGSIATLGTNMRRLREAFPEKEVMIVETAAYYSHENDQWAKPGQYSEFYPISVDGQRQFVSELVEELNKHENVRGLFWWFPEENAAGGQVTKGWLNRGLFGNHSGRALPALREFGKFGATQEQEWDWRAGATVSAEAVAAYGVGRCFAAEPIPDKVWARMQGKSYKPNPHIGWADLRYLRLLHYDRDGSIHLGEMVCNARIAERLVDIFRRLYDAKYPIGQMLLPDVYDADDERQMRQNNTSCFCYRAIAGTNRLSKHSRGLAVDLNTLYNPCVKKLSNGTLSVQPATGRKYADRTQSFPYKIDRSDLAYKLFTERGFTWGGSWRSTKDYQHFEFSGE